MRKRRTIDEDPGNRKQHGPSRTSWSWLMGAAFATGEVDLMQVPFSPLPPTPPEEWPIRRMSSCTRPPSPARPRNAGPPIPPKALLNGRPFDGAVETPLGAMAPGWSPAPITPVMLGPTPQRRSGTPTLVKQHRRSWSASGLPLWRQPAEAAQRASPVSPREAGKKDKMPAARRRRAVRSRPSHEEARDTTFYGFYDDLLDDVHDLHSRR